MRIAVCVKNDQEREMLIKWIGQYCDVYGRSHTIFSANEQECFFEENRRQPFRLAFLGLGGQEGLLMTQRLRETDKRCAVVMIDDTSENAVKGVRLHVSDYIVRPVDFKKVVRAMKLSLTGENR